MFNTTSKLPSLKGTFARSATHQVYWVLLSDLYPLLGNIYANSFTRLSLRPFML